MEAWHLKILIKDRRPKAGMHWRSRCQSQIERLLIAVLKMTEKKNKREEANNHKARRK